MRLPLPFLLLVLLSVTMHVCILIFLVGMWLLFNLGVLAGWLARLVVSVMMVMVLNLTMRWIGRVGCKAMMFVVGRRGSGAVRRCKPVFLFVIVGVVGVVGVVMIVIILLILLGVALLIFFLILLILLLILLMLMWLWTLKIDIIHGLINGGTCG